MLDFIFLLVSGNNDTDFEAQPSLEDKLRDFFSVPVYTWELPKKRAFLILGMLARWNPESGVLYQDQLIHLCGLDIGSDGPNNLRAVNIAISRTLNIKFVASGNAINRNYTFKDASQKQTMLSLVNEAPYSNIFHHLIAEIAQHRRRRW